jgi:hypothetical protein
MEMDMNFFFNYQFGVLLSAKWQGVVSLVPLSERRGVNLNYGTLGECLGTDELVVACIVDDIDYSRLASDALGAPRKVAVVETKSAVLFVATACSNRVYTLRAQSRVGRRSAQLELPLLSQLWTFATGGASLMPKIS